MVDVFITFFCEKSERRDFSGSRFNHNPSSVLVTEEGLLVISIGQYKEGKKPLYCFADQTFSTSFTLSSFVTAKL